VALAAHLALRDQVAVRQVNIDALQHELLRQGQVITFFRDIDAADPCCAAMQYFGTKGFFTDYDCRANDPLERVVARKWISDALGETGVRVAETLADEGALSCDELNGLFTGCGLSLPFAADGPKRIVTRGEFCRALYETVFPTVFKAEGDKRSSLEFSASLVGRRDRGP
jgi:hypothetical protein